MPRLLWVRQLALLALRLEQRLLQVWSESPKRFAEQLERTKPSELVEP